MAAYWQPLRATSKLNRRNRNIILNSVTKACKSGRVAYLSTKRTPVYFGGAFGFDTSFNTSGDLHTEELSVVLSDHPGMIQEEAALSADDHFEIETEDDFIQVEPAIYQIEADDIIEENKTLDI